MRKITQLRSRFCCNQSKCGTVVDILTQAHGTFIKKNHSWEHFKKHPKASLKRNKKLLLPQENWTNNRRSKAAMLPPWQPESNGGNMANFPGVWGRRLKQSISDSLIDQGYWLQLPVAAFFLLLFFVLLQQIRIMTWAALKVQCSTGSLDF